ncbi:MAG: lytic transglycosylase domain-containing protein [Spirochaetes bacterium]|nr:lytic transglycosylase domain-containing protein [Spirochaetota bacterium]
MILAGCSPSRGANLDLDSEVLSLALDEKKLPLNIEDKIQNNTINVYYQNSGTKARVVDFFTSLTRSKPVALAILDNAAKRSVPAGLAFAIAYEESRFNPKAYNENQNSIDRGLFQLNSTTFPGMSETQAFDPAYNAKEGVHYFKRILESAGNEVSALAMYNAGKTRVFQKGAPVTTLDYIARILNYEKNIDRLFTGKIVARNAMLANIRMGLLAKGAY